MTQHLRVFVSSPGDVGDERRQCAEVVEELNATLRGLVPERDVRLELLTWETHTHPDLGAGPQSVVDQQLDPDYDIYLGIMWARLGTPTATAPSGTVHEFRAAKRGWETTGRPAHILFYFCDAPIGLADAGPLAEQLGAVWAFRTELSHLGLVGVYEDRARFGDKLRRDLVHVLSKLLRAGDVPPEVPEETRKRTSAADLDTVRAQVSTEADEYEETRRRMLPGNARTRRMEVIASRMRSLAQSTYPLVPELTSSTRPGERLAAVCALQATPAPGFVHWLADRVCEEKPFVGYHAALALLAAARNVPESALPDVLAALEHAENCSARLRPDTDRSTTLAHVRMELSRRGFLT